MIRNTLMPPNAEINRSIFRAMDNSAMGLAVQRTRMNVISENLANVDTTRTPEGGPFRRKLVQIEQGRPGEKFADVFQKPRIEMKEPNDKHIEAKPFRHIVSPAPWGVHVAEITRDPSAFRMVFDPHHPDANEEGFVAMPNINPVQEMIDLITASRAFEANVTAINASKDMVRNALRI